MTTIQVTARSLFTGLLAAGATVCAGGTMPTAGVRTVAPSVVVMEMPAGLGPLQRPAVELDHAAHAEAFEAEGCTACHPKDDTGKLVPGLEGTVGIDDRDLLIEAYHRVCIDCHEQRSRASLKTGPSSCGACHVRRPRGVSARAAMRFDNSLHARHVIAAEEKCETCHHVWDETAERLRYEKGAEEACRTCHGDVDVGRNLSLENASHRSCISCHLERTAAAKKAGPTSCVGCHDPERQAQHERLAEVPRLKRGQPDLTWVHTEAAEYPAVPFDHVGHEDVADFCSDCHHQTLEACDTCHTLAGSDEGAGVSLEQSHHHPGSPYSCVGCHRSAAAERQCAGCHEFLSPSASARSCLVCHTGPSTADGVAAARPAIAEHQLEMLPEFSEDFPETVKIDVLVAEYEASVLPHGKIVRALDAEVRKSPLAVSFHGATETLCAGCHHHSPIGTRPPACRACHADDGERTSDHPGLKVAYHRQCIGCHIEMNVAKQSCTDCHALKEVQP